MASGKLTARKVETAKPGRHGDGAGLWLIVSPSGAKRWALRFNWQRKPTEAGLGAFPEIGLAEARDRALAARKLVKNGVNPIAERKRREGRDTLRTVADEFFKEHSLAWKSEVYRCWWRVSLQTHAEPILEKPIDEITAHDVSAILQPIWLSKPQTAALLRARLEKVFDFAKARRYREGENPALKRGGGIAHLLPKQAKREARNHPAMPFAEVPDFVRKLRGMATPWAAPLILQILTAVRPSEALGARWEEIDLTARIWRIPSARMKAGRSHEVPLSSEAVCLLEGLKGSRPDGAKSGLLFPGKIEGKPLAQGAMRVFMARIDANGSPHGFRSSFRDFLGEMTDIPREIAELCLAHTVGNQTERSYRRGTALERRRLAMELWADHVEGRASENVLRFQKSGGMSA
ncbi:hypothetical protein AMST5_01965 [freshwater sediment metagenome]|uniref:Integrase n=1 Tax=freshwater sediment metagenome TaxID=556182 RepID=A0AA48M115_9ZZZZ